MNQLGGLTARGFDRSYYQEHKRAGLDYAAYGDWQRLYGEWLVDALKLRGRVVLDVGCACGSIARGIKRAGALHVAGVDVCEHMIGLGRTQWELDVELHTCDAVNLHLFEAGTFDCIHSAQSAEHWRPELVPFILAELRRVAREHAWLFVALDTPELYARQGRDLSKEDPTHVCVKPLKWWEERLRDVGWAPQNVRHVTGHPIYAQHFSKHDWDLLLARAF